MLQQHYRVVTYHRFLLNPFPSGILALENKSAFSPEVFGFIYQPGSSQRLNPWTGHKTPKSVIWGFWFISGLVHCRDLISGLDIHLFNLSVILGTSQLLGTKNSKRTNLVQFMEAEEPLEPKFHIQEGQIHMEKG